MRRRLRAGRVAAAALAAAAVLAGCTGVPSDSAPMVIKTVPIGGVDSQAAATTPAAGILPNTLVADFLTANALDASSQTSPRAFLSPTARNSWSDTVVTVVETPTVGFFDPRKSTVVVRARVLGTVTSAGVYTPTLLGTDSPKQKFVYGVRQIDGRWRITSLRNGLLLSESDFLSFYTQRPVYYFDLQHRYLVPDPRWTSLTDPTQLADFLMTGLTTPPSDDISNAAVADPLPTRATAARISVVVGPVTRVEIPGASQLGATGRDRLAEQVAATLSDVVRSSDMTITDGGKPVVVPSVHSTRFAAEDFSSRTSLPTQPPFVYFLRGGRVYSQDGKELKGAVNNGSFFLQSVAVSQDRQQGTLAIAGTAGTTDNRRLLVGTQSGGLRETTVHGPLTRPAFAPGRSEVWVGDGTKIFAVSVDNRKRTYHVLPVGLPAGVAGGRIVALRLSPDGSRIAVVIRSARREQQLFVGAVVREPGQVRVDVSQVTPEGVEIGDVAWAEPLKLLAIGRTLATGEHHIYDVGIDGSGFSVQDLGNLPGEPITLTVAAHQQAWVTANKAVWRQAIGELWQSPGPTSETTGYGAVYLE